MFYFNRFRQIFLDVKDAQEPDVIIWENQHISSANRTIRTAIVMLITVILVGLSFGGIVYSKYYQDMAAKEYDVSMCGSTEVVLTEAYQDYLKKKEIQSGKFGCYCF